MITTSDYFDLWVRLKKEMQHIVEKEIGQISPYVVLGYMGFLEEIQRSENKNDKTLS